jgi:branched-chain amino acid transport system permease protein
MEHSATLVSIYALLALSFMLLLRVGEVSFGQQAFFGVGAYTSAIATTMFTFDLIPAVALGAIVGACLAWFVGFVALRLNGFGFSLFMLVFAECVREGFTQLTWQVQISGKLVGPEGAMGFTSIDYFARVNINPLWQAVIVCSTAMVLLLIAQRCLAGAWGRQIAAVNGDRELAEARGINSVAVRHNVFTAAGCIASAGGALFAHYVTFIDPMNFGLMVGVHALAYTLIGGIGHVAGALAGTVFDVVMLEWIRFAGPYRMVAFGALIVVALIVLPRGFFPHRNRNANVDL